MKKTSLAALALTVAAALPAQAKDHTVYTCATLDDDRLYANAMFAVQYPGDTLPVSITSKIAAGFAKVASMISVDQYTRGERSVSTKINGLASELQDLLGVPVRASVVTSSPVTTKCTH